MVILLTSHSDNNTNGQPKNECEKEKDDMSDDEKTKQIENDPAVKARLRKLFELAITIGRREGLIGNHSEMNTEGEKDVTDKGNIRNSMAATTRENQAGD